MSKKVVFRADGSAEIGYGHFIRTLGIAGLINQDFYCIYATSKPTEYQLNEIQRVCKEVKVLNDPDPLSDEFIDFLVGDEIVVLDNYFFTSAYQLRVKNKGCVVIYIDDLNEKHFVCDALINNIPGFDITDFKKEPYTELYLGTDYALLRKEFLDKKWRGLEKNNKKVFISFGGSDINNITGKIAQFLNRMDRDLEVNVLVGDGYRHLESLKRFDGIAIHKNVSAAEVAGLMATSSVCIVPASSLVNEAGSIGVPLLIGYFTDNQLRPYHYFVDNNLAVGVNDYRSVLFETFRDKFAEAVNSETLVENQRSIYRYQQRENLLNIFYKYGK